MELENQYSDIKRINIYSEKELTMEFDQINLLLIDTSSFFSS